MPWSPRAHDPLEARAAGWSERPRPRGSRWFPVVVAAVFQLPGLVIVLSDGAHHPLTALAVAAAFLSSGLLALGRAHPGAVVVAVAAVCTPAIVVTTGPPVAAVPLAFAVVGAVVRGARVWAWWTVAGFAVAAPLAGFLLTELPISMIRPLILALFLSLLVGVGEALRNRRERYREVSRALAARREAAAEAERLRIARELHDVLAHSLSQISVQAGVGLHLFDSRPEKARESLEAIKATSGQALEEVRGVLGFLRSDGYADRSPEPDLTRIPVLVETYRRAGLEVSYENGLSRGASPATAHAIYRIVQEALTNTGRHAQARTVRIRIAEEGDWYILTVADDGRGRPDGVISDGKGMLGMRERAELLGGRFSTHETPGGGLTVEARLPARPAEAS